MYISTAVNLKCFDSNVLVMTCLCIFALGVLVGGYVERGGLRVDRPASRELTLHEQEALAATVKGAVAALGDVRALVAQSHENQNKLLEYAADLRELNLDAQRQIERLRTNGIRSEGHPAVTYGCPDCGHDRVVLQPDWGSNCPFCNSGWTQAGVWGGKIPPTKDPS